MGLIISVENHIPVKKEFSEAFEARFKEGTHHVQDSPGFLRNEVLRPIKGDHYIIRTYWDTVESFEKWTKSEAFKQAHANTPPTDMFAGENCLTIHEVLVQTPSGQLATTQIGPSSHIVIERRAGSPGSAGAQRAVHTELLRCDSTMSCKLNHVLQGASRRGRGARARE